MSIHLPGLAIGGYRSFGPKIQRMGPFGKINLFIGANNSGKSNVLQVISNHLGATMRPGRKPANTKQIDWELDGHNGVKNAITLGIGSTVDHPHTKTVIAKVADTHQKRVLAILASPHLTFDTGCFWFDGQFHGDTQEFKPLDHPLGIEIQQITHHQWLEIARCFQPNLNSSLNHAKGAIFQELSTFKIPLPSAYMIPADRSFHLERRASWGLEDFGGDNMLSSLALLRSPSHVNRKDEERFKAIVQFVRDVLDDPEADLQIPEGAKELNVTLHGNRLPLQSLGTGIHQVVIFAAASLLAQKSIICLEEPELHLHPILQRKLVRFLRDRTENQYFISTHSAHLFDAVDDAACFRVSLDNGATVVTRIKSPEDKWQVCRDLGYRASDIVQANCVIWVEGPSDRLYIRHWLNQLAPDLTEGIEYAIMHYGGRLLNHLSPHPDEVEDFIALCHLNRHVAVVMDSDRKRKADGINDTKERVGKALVESNGFAWVTAGREIENYVEPAELVAAVDAVRPGAGANVQSGRYMQALPKKPNANRLLVEKLDAARQVIKKEVGLGRFDLKEQLEKLVAFIRAAQ